MSLLESQTFGPRFRMAVRVGFCRAYSLGHHDLRPFGPGGRPPTSSGYSGSNDGGWPAYYGPDARTAACLRQVQQRLCELSWRGYAAFQAGGKGGHIRP